MTNGPDEFQTIAELFGPLTDGTAGAFGLMDDAAVIAARPGHDLVVSKDALVEGVHFLADDPLDAVARKLLRVNLSDLAAKGAEPYAYLLAVAWSPCCGWAQRRAFAQGLRADQDAFGLVLLGGDTVSTPGPLTASVTILGWVPAGTLVPRSGAAPGQSLYVSGTIGDGFLGLAAARGELDALGPDAVRDLARHYRLPTPRLDLREAVRRASAAADVSDGLIADAGRIARASGVGLDIDLARLPLSLAAAAWTAMQPDRAAALIALATGGDDYQLICTGRDLDDPRLIPIGRVRAGEGVAVSLDGTPFSIERAGYVHR